MSALDIILIDNFDSFTYNLVDQFRSLGANVKVFRNDVNLDRVFSNINPNSLIVLSPGPGNPDSAGNCLEIIKRYAGKLPILGVCLGHQSIIQAFGGTIGAARQIVHGKAANVFTQGHPVFSSLANPFRAARYHSLAASQLPRELESIATCDDTVMAVAHRQLKILGFQFHPESILTTQGKQLLSSALTWLTATENSSQAKVENTAVEVS